MSRRSYVSVVRADAAAEKRERVIAAAAQFLRQETSVASFSIDAVAKAAGVTRLTVYNQFGSRRGLLEAVFDGIGERGGLVRLKTVMSETDPLKGLDKLVAIFCEFWASDPAIGHLHDAMALDAEFAEAVMARNERRRYLLKKLMARIAENTAPASAQRDAVDVVFALTSCATFQALASNRKAEAVCEVLTSTVQAVVHQMLSGGVRPSKR